MSIAKAILEDLEERFQMIEWEFSREAWQAADGKIVPYFLIRSVYVYDEPADFSVYVSIWPRNIRVSTKTFEESIRIDENARFPVSQWREKLPTVVFGILDSLGIETNQRQRKTSKG